MKTTSNHKIKIQNCVVKWTLKNIRNEVFERDGTKVTIPTGYYTFSDLKSFLGNHGVTIEKQTDSKIKLRADKDLNLKDFGEKILGFDKEKSITKNTDYISSRPADFLNGLKRIDIHSSLVDPMHNFEHDAVTGYSTYSNILVSLPVDTTQSLNGTFSIYDMRGTSVPCRDSNHQELSFLPFSGGVSDDYEVFLDLEINV